MVILEVGLARTLAPDTPEAPRWQKPGSPPADGKDFYLDHRLGFEVARMIRTGRFRSIPSNTPLIFFTSQNSRAVREAIEAMEGATRLGKPAFFREVHRLVDSVTRQTTPSGNE